MPVQPTYPGVYIEEVPSGVRTITGVSTSVTAFVGRTKRGPVNDPIVINSYADFENIFGGLWTGSKLGYAVRDFYLNGGKQAIIVRLFHPTVITPGTPEIPATEGPPPQPAVPATPPVLAVSKAKLDANNLILEAAHEGTWGNFLRARIDDDVKPGDTSLFNLIVRYSETDVTGNTTTILEEFRNVSITATHPRYVANVLKNESKLVRATTVPNTVPDPHDDPDPTADPPVLLWEDNDTNDWVKGKANTATDGDSLDQNDFTGPGLQGAKKGLYALEKADIFNLLCIPPYKDDGDADVSLFNIAAAYCKQRRAFLIVDPPAAWNDKAKAIAGLSSFTTSGNNHAALFFPRLVQPDPLADNQLNTFVPCGAVAGVFARTDATRGVWKAPAGQGASLVGVPKLSVPLSDPENGELNPLGINCLRALPAAGRVIWGSRTLEGADRLASEWKYIPIRRLALYIEESLYRGTQWVVFEPNDEPLWAQIRLNVGVFMHTLFRQGAFQGSSPKEAYFVKCDKDTTPQADIDRGIVNIVVGFAPLKPAEFVIIKIQQIAGQLEA